LAMAEAVQSRLAQARAVGAFSRAEFGLRMGQPDR
jgi:hypothetical protein